MIYAFVNPDPLLTAHLDSSDGTDLLPDISTLLATATLIPVTGRDEQRLLEVPAAFTSWQILAHGAVVVTPEGTEDSGWRRLIRQAQATREQALTLAAQALEHIAMFAHLDLETEVVRREGYPLLIRVTHAHGLDVALDTAETAWRDWIEAGPFAADLRVIRERAVLSVLPAEISTDRAVNYVMGFLDDLTLSLGVGATEADRDFLSLCDLALVPGPLVVRESDSKNDDFGE